MSKKNKIYLIIISVFCLALVGVSVYYMNANADKVKLKKEVFTLEYGNPISMDAKDYVTADETVLKDVKVTVKYEKEKDKDYVAVGKYNGTVSYKKEKHKFKVKVEDTTAPKFEDLKKEIKIEQNAEKVDFAKYFKATDLSEVKISVDDKKVDLAKTGEYEMKVTASDAFNNKVTKKVKIIVVDAEKVEEVTETIDGEKPVSAETKQKIEEQAQQQHQQQATNNNNSSTEGTPNGGSTDNGGGGQPAPPIQPTPPLQPAEPVYRQDVANDCMAKINAWRVQNSVHELKHDNYLQSIANQRAIELLSDFSHNGAQTAENIAMCYGYDGAYQDFFISWKNSPGHNQNQLSPGYQTFAVAIVNYKGEWFGVTVFM